MDIKFGKMIIREIIYQNRHTTPPPPPDPKKAPPVSCTCHLSLIPPEPLLNYPIPQCPPLTPNAGCCFPCAHNGCQGPGRQQGAGPHLSLPASLTAQRPPLPPRRPYSPTKTMPQEETNSMSPVTSREIHFSLTLPCRRPLSQFSPAKQSSSRQVRLGR